MARPRRPFSGSEVLEAGSNGRWSEAIAPKPLGARQEIRWDRTINWTYRTPNGKYDPLTFLFVLDAVATVHPDVELRARPLVDYLEVARPQMVFDPVTVGMVLADLSDAFEDVLGVGNGLLNKSRDQKGHFYLLSQNAQTIGVYHRLREDLMALVEVERERIATRQKSMRIESPLLECPSLRGVWNGIV